MVLSRKRVISIFALTMFNVSIMASLRNLPLVASIGFEMIGFFVITALTFLIPSALVSAELATGWSKAGGIYVWVREALGCRWGFFAIWMQWAHNLTWYPAILSFVAATLAYIIDPALAQNKLFIISVILVFFWGMTLTNYFGIKTSSLLSTIGVIGGTIIPGLFIIAIAAFWVFSGRPTAILDNTTSFLPNIQSSRDLVFLGGFFLAFCGYEVSASYANEVKNPQKNYPKAIAYSAMITFFLFLFGALAISVVIPKGDISLVSGLIDALDIYLKSLGIGFLVPLMAFLLVMGALAEINSWIIGPVKALHTTSAHGNLPPIFQKLNKHGTPVNLLFAQATIVTLAAFVILLMPTLSSSYWILSAISAQMYLMMYVLMFIAAIRLRYTHPHIPRVYKIPHPHKGMWFIASIGMLASLFVIGISFVPPSHLKITNILGYELFLWLGLGVMAIIPHIIYQCRKEHWKAKHAE